jgi:hypothetical protein
VSRRSGEIDGFGAAAGGGSGDGASGALVGGVPAAVIRTEI